MGKFGRTFKYNGRPAREIFYLPNIQAIGIASDVAGDAMPAPRSPVHGAVQRPLRARLGGSANSSAGSTPSTFATRPTIRRLA